MRQTQISPDAPKVSNSKDEVAQRLLRDFDSAPEQRAVDEMAQVEATLHRLESGTCGGCTECGGPISARRLVVQPASQRCAPCQAVCEHALKRPGPRCVS